MGLIKKISEIIELNDWNSKLRDACKTNKIPDIVIESYLQTQAQLLKKMNNEKVSPNYGINNILTVA